MRQLLTEGAMKEVKQQNCFDFLRYFFAVSLIIAHFCTLTDIPQFWFITGGMRVKAFFTITGFLVTYSFLRRDCNVRSYVRKRLIRIVPAYVCAIGFCLLMGLVVTQLTTGSFLGDVQTWKYFFSNLLMLNWIEPELPATFQANPVPQMNGSLWSMKHEMIFYALVPPMTWVALRWGKRVVVVPVLVASVVLYPMMPVQLQYFTYFLSGMALLLYFEDFNRYRKYILPFALVSEVLHYMLVSPEWLTGVLTALEPLCFGIVLISVAYHVKWLNVFQRFDNVTYGLYLYHFPIIQMLIHYGVCDYDIRLCFVMALLLTCVMACLSWFLVEKPISRYFREK